MRLAMPRLRTPTSRTGNGSDALGTSLDGLRLSNPATPEPAKKQPPASTDSQGKKLCCDACDGPHLTAECPIYSKPRESHPDAKARPGLGAFGLKSAGNFALKGASVVRQPGDGACLFHSLSHGLQIPGVNATTLRARIAAWVQAHPDTVIAGDPLKDWVEWDTNLTVPKYAARVAKPSFWGGGIEMAATSHLFNANVHVYEADSATNGLKRISCFNVADFADKTATTTSSTLATTPIRRTGSTTSTSTPVNRATGFSPMGRRSLPSDLSRPNGNAPTGDPSSSSSSSSSSGAHDASKPSPLRPAKPWLTSSSKVLSEADADAAIAAAAASEGLSTGITGSGANNRAGASRRGVSSPSPARSSGGEPVTVHVLYRGGIHFDALNVPPDALAAAQAASDAAAAAANSSVGGGKGLASSSAPTRKPVSPRLSSSAASAYFSRTSTPRSSVLGGAAPSRLPGLARPSSAGKSSSATTTPSSSDGSSNGSSGGLPPFAPINASTPGDGGLGHSRSNSPRPPPSLRRLAANRTSAHTPTGLRNSSSHGSVGYRGPGVRPTNASIGSISPRKPGASLRERSL